MHDYGTDTLARIATNKGQNNVHNLPNRGLEPVNWTTLFMYYLIIIL